MKEFAAVQQQRVEQAVHVGRFRKETQEGVTVHVAFWSASGKPPRIVECVIKFRSAYVLADDVDFCEEVGYDPEQS